MKEKKEVLETQYYILEYYLHVFDKWCITGGYYSNATPKLYKEVDAKRVINSKICPENWRMIPVKLDIEKNVEYKDKENFKHLKFLKIAKIFATMSHCVSHQVGALLVKDGRILSSGVNGTPSGYINCDEVFKKYDSQIDRKIHMDFSDKYELHSEMGCLIQAAKEGICVKDTILYCTHQPCWNCLKLMIALGIKEIYFLYEYDRINKDANWWQFAVDNDVTIKQIKEEDYKFVI